jgi:hypothetical protein
MQPHATTADKDSGRAGGNVDRFRVGDVHCMALEAPLDELFMGGLIDRHLDEQGARQRAIWMDRAGE